MLQTAGYQAMLHGHAGGYRSHVLTGGRWTVWHSPAMQGAFLPLPHVDWQQGPAQAYYMSADPWPLAVLLHTVSAPNKSQGPGWVNPPALVWSPDQEEHLRAVWQGDAIRATDVPDLHAGPITHARPAATLVAAQRGQQNPQWVVCMFSPADAHIVVCNPEGLPEPEAVFRVADSTRMIVKALREGEHHALLLQVRLKDSTRAARPGVWPAAAHPADLELQPAVPTAVYHWLPDRPIGTTHWQAWLQTDGQRDAFRSLGPAPAIQALAAAALGRALAPHTVPLANLPFKPAPEGAIRKSVPLPPGQGATGPTKCPLCANKYYTSWAMLEHLAWHAVHAAAPVDDKEAASNILQGRARRSPWHAPYARRPPPGAADHADSKEEGPGAGPGTGGAAQQGSIPTGLAPLAPLWALLGTGSPHPMAPVHQGALAAAADLAAMPMRDGSLQEDTADDALWPLSWNLRNGLVPPDRSLRDSLRRRRGTAACTDKEHLITGMQPREGGFSIMLQETGIATRAQEMHLAAALRDKGYTSFFSSRLAETGATSTSRGGGLLTAVSSKYMAEHEVLSFTALEIRMDGGGLTLINVHRPQAGCSPWAGRAAFWADIQMYATAQSLGGRHPVIIAGDTNVYMDATFSLATEHFRAGWEACGFWRATAGGEEDMTPTLHPSRHRVDTFLVNEPLLPWSLRESVWARGMAQPQVLGLDNLLVRLALPGLLNVAGRATMPTSYSHRVGRLLPYDAEAAPFQHCLWAASPPRRMNPPWHPGAVPQSSTAMGPCPRAQWTRCSNTSTRRMTPWHVWWDAGSRPRRGRTRLGGTPRRAGKGSRRRSSAMTPWQRARRRRTRRTRHGMASGPRRRSGSERSCGVRRPGSARPHRATYRRSWRGKQLPSKRTSANSAHSWRQTASTPSRISGAATPRTSPSGGKPCGEP